MVSRSVTTPVPLSAAPGPAADTQGPGDQGPAAIGVLIWDPAHFVMVHRVLEVAAALRSVGVPYRMHAHADLFCERAVRDLVGYLGIAYNPADRASACPYRRSAASALGRLQATLLAEPTTVAELTSLASQFEAGDAAAAALSVVPVGVLTSPRAMIPSLSRARSESVARNREYLPIQA